MHLTITYDLLPKRRTTRTAIVMDHFGIDFETGRHVVAENLELPIVPGDVVLFTGPSGAGKSSLLRAAAAHFQASPGRQQTIIDINTLELPDVALVDALPLPLIEALRLLAQCGLGEAQLLLRTPAELSDGQRYRFRLALAVATAVGRTSKSVRGEGDEAGRTDLEISPHQLPGTSPRLVEPDASASRLMSSAPHQKHDEERTDLGVRPTQAPFIVADEFTATLDRTLAQVVAFNVRRLADRTGIGFLLATTHADIATDLAPDVHVRCRLDGEITVERHSVGRTSKSVRPQSDEPQWTDLEIGPHQPPGARALSVITW